MKELIHEESYSEIDTVNSVASYLEKISLLINDSNRYVFRGECKYYETTCIPNIFRNIHYNRKRLEKSLLEKIRSEGFDNEESYLLTAIEAQHGGFPSRLLDVSFNSLIALFFAVTPHYNEKVDSIDDEDGLVTILKTNEFVSPASRELNIIYSENILDEHESHSYPINAYNHIFVDYYRKNKRIQAQQGAFILFQGKSFRPLPESIKRVLRISKESKKEIREELESMFGYTNAFVYPEPNNFANEFSKVVPYFAEQVKFSVEDQLNQFTKNCIRDVEFRLNSVLDHALLNWPENEIIHKLDKLIIKTERYIVNTLIDFEATVRILDCKNITNNSENYHLCLGNCITGFNEVMTAISNGQLQISDLQKLLSHAERMSERNIYVK